jgi:hypothetical protein
VVAFARQYESTILLAIVPRLVTSLVAAAFNRRRPDASSQRRKRVASTTARIALLLRAPTGVRY